MLYTEYISQLSKMDGLEVVPGFQMVSMKSYSGLQVVPETEKKSSQQEKDYTILSRIIFPRPQVYWAECVQLG